MSLDVALAEDDSHKKGSSLKRSVIDFTAGLGGGIAQVFTGHPFDTVKVRLQTQGSGDAALYKGTADCIKKTIQADGFMGLYRGVASPLVGMGLFNAAMFFSYGRSKDLLGIGDHTVSATPFIAAGAATGLVVSFIESPVDLFKCQLQVQSSTNRTYNGVFDCAKQVFSKYGMRGVYHGLFSTMLRDVPANATYFYTYEALKRKLLEREHAKGKTNMTLSKLPSLLTFMAGGIAGMTYWTFVYPFDVIKSAVQSDSLDPAKRRYNGIIDCTKKLYADGGIPRFFRGVVPCLLRSFPANAACFLTYEQLRTLMLDE